MSIFQRLKEYTGIDISAYEGLAKHISFYEEAISNETGWGFYNLEETIKFAYDCHKTQLRVSGEPYIHHVLRVADSCAKIFSTTSAIGIIAIITALLHDVVEDGHTTHETIQLRYQTAIADSVKDLCRLKEESYFAFIGNLSRKPQCL